MFLGLRSHILTVDDLDATKAWYTRILGIEPYFDEMFYVGFEVGGFELGLLPGLSPGYPVGGLTYWGVEYIDTAWAELLEAGAEPAGDIADVGGGIRLGEVFDPSGNRIGIIENPNFGT